MNESRTLRHMIGYNKESGTPTCMYVKGKTWPTTGTMLKLMKISGEQKDY